jgi:hypothetical protein
MSQGEDALRFQLRAAGVEDPDEQHVFARPRRWRFDFAWPAVLVAAEVEGGSWIKGHHSFGKGFEADCEKYNAATLLGWRVYRVTPAMIDDGRALALVEQALGYSVARPGATAPRQS